MSEFKKMWSETSRELDSAFDSLGKTIVKSAKLGIRRLNDWANSDDVDKNSTASPENKGN